MNHSRGGCSERVRPRRWEEKRMRRQFVQWYQESESRWAWALLLVGRRIGNTSPETERSPGYKSLSTLVRALTKYVLHEEPSMHTVIIFLGLNIIWPKAKQIHKLLIDTAWKVSESSWWVYTAFISCEESLFYSNKHENVFKNFQKLSMISVL